MIQITEEMKNQTQQEFDKICQRVDSQIKKAVDQNLTSCYFACDKDIVNPNIYNKVRKAYESNGYTITPTGCIGGIWQKTENINW